jgi:hypothetical protein
VRPDAPEAVLGDVARRVRDHGVDFALVGGLAVSIRRGQDLTRKLDELIAAARAQTA